MREVYFTSGRKRVCMNDEFYMQKALALAKAAKQKDEVPIGCVIVLNGKIIASGYNLRESRQDATCHAEIIAIKKACKKLKSWRLNNCVMYVTLEPCVMCFGAILNSRIEKVVYGALDTKNGASLYNVSNINLNHKTENVFLNTKECSDILTDYFKNKRNKPES